MHPVLVTILNTHKTQDGVNMLASIVEHVSFMGSYQHVRMIVGAQRRLHVQTANDAHWREGDSVLLAWRPEDGVVVTPSDEASLSTAPPDAKGASS